MRKLPSAICTNFTPKNTLRAFLRAFFEDKFGSALNFLYLCIVNEKRRNLRPAQTAKFACARGKYFLGKAKKGVEFRDKENIKQFINNQFINHLKRKDLKYGIESKSS